MKNFYGVGAAAAFAAVSIAFASAVAISPPEAVSTAAETVSPPKIVTPDKKTRNSEIEIRATNDRVLDADELVAILDNQAKTTSPFQSVEEGKYKATVALRPGLNNVQIKWKRDSEYEEIESFKITRDVTGPILEFAELIENPVRGTLLYMRFADDYWRKSPLLDRNSFIILRQDKSGKFADLISSQGTPQIEDHVVELSLPKLYEGLYELRIYGTAPKTPTNDTIILLKDDGDNLAKAVVTFPDGGTGQRWEFSALGERKFGRHVPFPQYAPPKFDEPPKEGFNPADFVTTRVVRLYYFRDAHRVAQIINRNVRSLGVAAVKQAQRRAEKARFEADDRTDERRGAERAAVRAAQAARNAENKLANSRQDLRVVNQLDGEIAATRQQSLDVKKKLGDIQQLAEVKQADAAAVNAGGEADGEETKADGADKELADERDGNNDPDRVTALTVAAKEQRKIAVDARKTADKLEKSAKDIRASHNEPALQKQEEALNSQITDLSRQRAQFDTPESLGKTTRSMEQSVANLRQAAIDTQETSDVAQAKEDRAREKQFRQEVAAAEEDPDTYVAADVESIDPVTQVSVSVIGEGLIHLRGPIKGINKIRLMVNQIDAPLGQIKIGIHTIQVNGEHGDRMEKVIGRIEGHIDLSRFLM